jgi:hypothetical protein
VGAASQPEVLDRGFAPASDFEDVIELEPGVGGAAHAGFADERAARAVTLPHRLADGFGNVPRVPGGLGLAVLRAELGPLELLDERVESTLEHFGHVMSRNLVAQQPLYVAQLAVRAFVQGRLERITLGSDRPQLRT